MIESVQYLIVLLRERIEMHSDDIRRYPDRADEFRAYLKEARKCLLMIEEWAEQHSI